jgi:hypothetical protein
MLLVQNLFFTKYVLGYILGDFFAATSGHPVCQWARTLAKELFSGCAEPPFCYEWKLH